MKRMFFDQVHVRERTKKDMKATLKSDMIQKKRKMLDNLFYIWYNELCIISILYDICFLDVR